MKIVYVLNSICYFGGIERVTISKANAFAEMPGNEVWIIVTENYFDPVLPLSPKVKLLDLKIGYYRIQATNLISEFWKDIKKRREHKRAIIPILEDIGPDVVISVGQCEKYFLPTIKLSSNPVFIREIHYYKHYRRDFADSWIKKMIARISEWYDFCWKIKNYDAIISLTETDKQRYWNNNPKVKVMPNPIIARPSLRSVGNNKIVMAAGRLVEQKNYQALLRVWKSVEAKHPDWSLYIWGDGEQKNLLIQQIKNLGLAHAELKGYTPHVIEHYPEASVFAVTSHYEGFALMIVEAMAAGVPVVSYDCPCSPRDIIADGVDGWLVMQDDEETLADRICWMIEHEEERKKMGEAAFYNSAQYDISIVARKWIALFEDLITKRVQ